MGRRDGHRGLLKSSKNVNFSQFVALLALIEVKLTIPQIMSIDDCLYQLVNELADKILFIVLLGGTYYGHT